MARADLSRRLLGTDRRGMHVLGRWHSLWAELQPAEHPAGVPSMSRSSTGHMETIEVLDQVASGRRVALTQQEEMIRQRPIPLVAPHQRIRRRPGSNQAELATDPV